MNNYWFKSWQGVLFAGIAISQLALLGTVCVIEHGYNWSKREWLATSLINIALILSLTLWAYKSSMAPSRTWYRRTVLTFGLSLSLLAYDGFAIVALLQSTLDVPILIGQLMFAGVFILPFVVLLFLTTLAVEFFQRRQIHHGDSST